MELDRLVKEGHLEIVGTWEQVTARWPKARATKLATLVKEKGDGSVKTRFVADMRRSGINGLASASERIVLPRACDVVRDALDLLEGNAGLEFFSADFSDAFLNLAIAEEERGYAVVRTASGDYAAYKGVPFGLATAPLGWGRTAAWIGRATQALSQEWRSRTHIYVDDPICIVRGDRASRTFVIAKVLAFWAALGARIALHKAASGQMDRGGFHRNPRGRAGRRRFGAYCPAAGHGASRPGDSRPSPGHAQFGRGAELDSRHSSDHQTVCQQDLGGYLRHGKAGL